MCETVGKMHSMISKQCGLKGPRLEENPEVGSQLLRSRLRLPPFHKKMSLCFSMPLLVTAMDNNVRHSRCHTNTWRGKQALQGHWHTQPKHKNQSTPAMYPNGHEAGYPVCMCGSVCLSVLDAACRAPPSSAHGTGCCEHSVPSPGGRPSPGADHGGQGWGLEEAGGQAHSSLRGHILRKNQPSSERASGHSECNSASGSSGSSG